MEGRGPNLTLCLDSCDVCVLLTEGLVDWIEGRPSALGLVSRKVSSKAFLVVTLSSACSLGVGGRALSICRILVGDVDSLRSIEGGAALVLALERLLLLSGRLCRAGGPLRFPFSLSSATGSTSVAGG